MNVQEKAQQQKVIQSVLTGLGAVIAKLVKDRDANAAQLQDLNMNGGKQFSQEYLEKEMQRVKVNFSVKMTEVYKDIETRLENLRKLITERDAVLDLTNPAFQTALTLIQAVGEPSLEQAAQINQNFRYDQKSLNAIFSAYGKKDLGGIMGMMYEVNSKIDELKELANNCTVKEGSVNYFASRLAKLAAIEGVELVSNPDERGIMEAYRIGAGLK